MTTEMIPIHLIRRDGGTQSRAAINPDVVAEYAELMTETAGASPFPAVCVVFDGEAYWLWDGFHRIEAAMRVGFRDIETEIRPGTRRDAVLLSCGANADHGLRRANADKRHAVETLLRDTEWGNWSDREISRRCGVSNNMVSEMRKAICHPMTDKKRTTRRAGTVYMMKTPSRPGKPLEELERQDGDDGETGLEGQNDAPITEQAQEDSHDTLQSPTRRSGGLGDPDHGSHAPLSQMPVSFARLIEDLRLVIGEARKTNWAKLNRSDARHQVKVLLALIDLS